MTAMDAGGRIPEWTQGDRLRKAREATGLTTREFAQEIGVSQKTISDAENDRRAVRKITLMAYAMRTGVPLSWLETGMAPRPEPGGHPEKYTAGDSDPEPAGSQRPLVTAPSLALVS